MVHHEGRHQQKNQRGYRISPRAIWPWRVWVSHAQLDNAEHGEERAEQQRKLNEIKPTASKLRVNSIRFATASWNRIANAGAPWLDLRANSRNAGMSSPIVIMTRGPIHIIALMEDTSPIQIIAPTPRPPISPNM